MRQKIERAKSAIRLANPAASAARAGRKARGAPPEAYSARDMPASFLRPYVTAKCGSTTSSSLLSPLIVSRGQKKFHKRSPACGLCQHPWAAGSNTPAPGIVSRETAEPGRGASQGLEV